MIISSKILARIRARIDRLARYASPHTVAIAVGTKNCSGSVGLLERTVSVAELRS